MGYPSDPRLKSELQLAWGTGVGVVGVARTGCLKYPWCSLGCAHRWVWRQRIDWTEPDPVAPSAR